MPATTEVRAFYADRRRFVSEVTDVPADVRSALLAELVREEDAVLLALSQAGGARAR